jgi:hypothetical protein
MYLWGWVQAVEVVKGAVRHPSDGKPMLLHRKKRE